MTTTPIRRTPRMQLPELPSGDISLQPPPAMPRPSGSRIQSLGQMVMFLPMMLGFGGMSLLTSAQRGGPTLYLWGGIFAISIGGMLFMMLVGGSLQKKAELNDERRDYLRYLENVRADVRDVATVQRARLTMQHPAPQGLSSMVISSRLWERRRLDRDFGQVRLATGPQQLAATLKTPQTAPLDELDPLSATSLRRFVRTYSTVPDLPVALSVCSFPRVSAFGERSQVMGLIRAVVAQLATFHGPADVRIAVCASLDSAPEWEWLKWLPHSLHLTSLDAAGPVRLAAEDFGTLTEVLGDELGQRQRYAKNASRSVDLPHVVVIRDGGHVDPDTRLADETGLQGVTVIDVSERPEPAGPYGLQLIVDGTRLGVVHAGGIQLIGVPDQLDLGTANALAKSMSKLYDGRPVSAEEEQPLSANFGLAELLRIGDPRSFDVAATWRPRSRHKRLRVPLGLDAQGQTLDLDFKESAEEGMGPHGLIIGATGSGKSELLRTLVLALAVTHSSEVLNFVLVDFKGGASFTGLGDLPHTSAVITNLADDLTLVNRMKDALEGEMMRRQEVLHQSNYASARDYERAREAGADLKPLPSLMVIIDEFSELLANQPDFIDTFVMIGRLGRSLGVHLLLASQRLEEGRLRGLDSHLSYRIGLRTFSTSESRSVLGVPDAGELPPIPGSAFLRTDSSTLIRFKAAYVSGPAPLARVEAPSEARTVAPRLRVLPFSLAGVDAPAETEAELTVADVLRAAPGAVADDSPFGETVLDVMVDRIRGRGPEAHQVWLPPLDVPPSVTRLLPRLVQTERGLIAADYPGAGRLSCPIGIVDKPYEQQQDLLTVDLSGAAGNVAIVGSPQSGKSTLLRSLITSMALTHSPEEVQFFCLDFGGGALSSIKDLPHVSGVASRLDAERVSRTVAEVASIFTARERLFAERGIDSIGTFRRRRRAGEVLEDRPLGDVFLVVDGWLTFRDEFEWLYDVTMSLASRGLGYGVHVILTSNRWMDVRAQVRDAISTRLELKLGDAFDSELDRKVQEKIPEATPGRGVSKDKLHFLGAIPVLASHDPDGDLAEGVAALVQEVAEGWSGPPAPPVRLLPRLVAASELSIPGVDDAVADGAPLRLPIGLGEADLAPMFHDFDADPFLLVFGDGEAGKSGFLRHLAVTASERCSRDRVRVVAVDYRRALLGELPEEYLVGYAGGEGAMETLIGQTCNSLRSRLPGPDVTPSELRNRSWWSGPDLLVLVDDYDLVSAGENPLLPLLEFLPQARDVGLRLVVTRRSGGASRALYDPLPQRMIELGGAGLLMAGSPEEGPVMGGVKLTSQPPGRATVVRRGANAGLVQLAWREPQHG